MCCRCVFTVPIGMVSASAADKVLRLPRAQIETLGYTALDGWTADVTTVLEKSTVDVPRSGWHPGGGRRGRHSEHMGYLLAEMQYLHRVHPGATW